MFKELSDNLKSIKKIHSETKYTLIEIKNNLQGNNSRVDKAENQINDLEHKEAKSNQSEQEEKRILKIEDSEVFWENFKSSNIYIIEVPEGEDKEQEIGDLFEIIVEEKFPNLVKEIDMQVQETQRVPSKIDAKRSTPRHIIIKMPKVKEKRES